MREKHGFKQQEVSSNLDYLLQKGWANEVVETRTFTTPRGTTQPSEKVTYKISDVGIDHLEGASLYRKPFPDSRVNITNIQGVTVVGDGNVVNTEFAEAAGALWRLREDILASDLDDEAKLEVVADIDALQSQLQKPNPDPTVIEKLWGGIDKVVTAGGLVELASKVGELLGPLLS